MKKSFYFLAMSLIINTVHAQDKKRISLHCQETIVETKNYGPVALTLKGSLELPLRLNKLQTLEVASDNAFKKQSNAPGETNSVTVNEVHFLSEVSSNQGRHYSTFTKYAVRVSLGVGNSAFNKTPWFVCSEKNPEGEI